jgi:phosphoribosyl-ATP pyrophosphohydrolase
MMDIMGGLTSNLLPGTGSSGPDLKSLIDKIKKQTDSYVSSLRKSGQKAGQALKEYTEYLSTTRQQTSSVTRDALNKLARILQSSRDEGLELIQEATDNYREHVTSASIQDILYSSRMKSVGYAREIDELAPFEMNLDHADSVKISPSLSSRENLIDGLLLIGMYNFVSPISAAFASLFIIKNRFMRQNRYEDNQNTEFSNILGSSYGISSSVGGGTTDLNRTVNADTSGSSLADSILGSVSWFSELENQGSYDSVWVEDDSQVIVSESTQKEWSFTHSFISASMVDETTDLLDAFEVDPAQIPLIISDTIQEGV